MIDKRYANVAVIVIALTLAVSVAAAGGPTAALQEQQETQQDAEMTQDSSFLRVAHASPDAPAVNVTVGNDTVAENVSFGEVTAYTNVTAGPTNVTVTSADDASVEVFEGNLTIEPREVVTVTASGEISTEAESSFNATVMQDNAWAPSDDQAAVSVAHFSPDAEEVDVVVVEGPDEGDDAAETPGADEEDTPAEDEEDTTPAEDEDATPADEETDTPAEDEDATPAEDETETPADEEGTPAEDEEGTPAEDDTVGEDETATPAEDDATAEEDVTMAQEDNETVLAEGLEFRNASDYVNVQSGDYTVEIREASPDNDGEVLATVDLSVEGGQAYTVMAAGYAQPDDAPAGEEFTVFPVQDASMTLNLPEDGMATDTPAAEETETPAEDEDTTPAENETDMPAEDETDTPAEDEDTTPADEETDTPADEEGTPAEDDTADEAGTETPTDDGTGDDGDV